MTDDRKIAYFSMEIGLIADMPTYSGGLGVLAGDTIRAAADLKVPMVAVTLVYRRGYCRQRLDAQGNQSEEPVEWTIEDFLDEMSPRVSVRLGGRDVRVRAWLREVVGSGGFRVPVFFLDTNLPENHEQDQGLTDQLYGGDARYRLCQEAILGIGGCRMLMALAFHGVHRFHMNEGHASLLACELLNASLRGKGESKVTSEAVESVRRRCVFTTHTPVPAGHDQFPLDVVHRVLDPRMVGLLQQLSCVDGALNMTYLALHLSHFVNGVARRHGEISRSMFAPYPIDAITNGVHASTWVAPALAEVLDRNVPEWREDNLGLRYAISIPNREIWDAHLRAKKELLEHVNSTTNAELDTDVFTIGFARRAAAYKRGDLLFFDLEALRRIQARAGAFQVVLAGKAHPHDWGGKEVIRRIFQARDALQGSVKVVYLADYDLKSCKLMTSGVDLWLNTPEPPLEASGTSGMKAALNGVPSLSILDGWWVEGWIEGTTGWSIGEPGEPGTTNTRDQDAYALCEKLEQVILPLFYKQRERYVDVMRHCIALNGSFFNAQRMLQQYVVKAYF